MTVKIPQITEEDVADLKRFVSSTIQRIGCKGVVVGLSGGVDSATVTKLCVDALGPEKVLNVFMPSRVTPAEDYKTTSELSSMWGTEYRVVDVQPAVDALAAVLLSGRETPLERGNISARCRMIVLYNLAKKRDYVVMGTSNQSELMMGYFTKFGDGACDVTPLANMYKTLSPRPPDCGRVRPTSRRWASPTRTSTGSCTTWSRTAPTLRSRRTRGSRCRRSRG